MKIRFQDGWMYLLEKPDEGSEDETPTLRGHIIPAPSEEQTVDVGDFQTIGQDSFDNPETFQKVVQELSE